MTKAKLAKNLLKRVLIKGKDFEWYEIDGLRNGEYKSWYANGQLDVYCYFTNNQFDGEYKEWYGNGQLEQHCYYKNGERNGEYKRWSINGKLLKHCYYKDGMKVND